MTLPGGKPGNIGVKIVTNESYQPDPAATTPLPVRWATAERNFLAGLLSRAPESLQRRADRILFIREAAEKLIGYGWSTPRNRVIFEAILRSADRGEFPTPAAIRAETDRLAATEASAFVEEIQAEFPGDADVAYWLGQMLEQGRACEAYSAAERFQAKLDAGQSILIAASDGTYSRLNLA